MSDDNLYYSKSKNKYIKIAEMPDQHVRRAFLIMNKQNGLSISGNEETIQVVWGKRLLCEWKVDDILFR